MTMVAATLLLAKALAMSFIHLASRQPLGRGTNEWPAVLDKSLSMFRYLSGSGPAGASQAYSIIVPGTLWCGQGSKATSFEELGIFRGPDECCRDHDHCPDSIAGNATRHGLHNNRTISSALCACDHKFLQCLRKDGSVIAREVGKLYFDFLDPVCFSYEFPIKRCKRHDKGKKDRRCVEYEYDTNRPPEWHFEDFPYYYGSARALREVDVPSEAAAALAGQERPDLAVNGEDAELWNALLMNRHVRFGSNFGDKVNQRRSEADADDGWSAVIGSQVFPGADENDFS